VLFGGGPAAGPRPVVPRARTLKTTSGLLYDVLAGVYADLGFDALGDEVFRDLVIARVVEPTSLLDAGRVLAELGRVSASRRGFPLEIGCFEGNKAEKHTILPVISQFRARHGTGNFAVVADTGMLSAANLAVLDIAGCKFIVGSWLTKAPIDLESHFRWHGDYFGDGQVIDTLTPKTGRNHDNDPALLAEPVQDPRAHPASWRAVWAYSRNRAVRDTKTLTAQENRARDVITGGGKAARMPGSSRPPGTGSRSTRPRSPAPGAWPA
jgi:hypothetical protein